MTDKQEELKRKERRKKSYQKWLKKKESREVIKRATKKYSKTSKFKKTVSLNKFGLAKVIRKDYGTTIKRYREMAGISTYGLEKQGIMPSNTIGAVERGEAYLSPKKLLDYLTALGVGTPERIVEEIESKKYPVAEVRKYLEKQATEEFSVDLENEEELSEFINTHAYKLVQDWVDLQKP